MKESQIQKEILHWLSLQPKDQMFSWRMYTGPIVRGNPAKGKTFFTPNPCPGLPAIKAIESIKHLTEIDCGRITQ